MNLLLVAHIAAGLLGLAAGTTAIAARRGGRLHARAGTLFAAAMLFLGLSATVLAWFKPEPDPGLGGVFTCYLVATAWVAARRRDGRSGRFEIAACALALGAAAVIAWGGFAGPGTPLGAGPVFALAVVCLLAGLLDLHAVLRRTLTPAQRLSRHLWRMCFAFFVATGSFFLGQQDVLPAIVRGSPVLFVLAFAPLGAMAWALIQLRLGPARRKAIAASG